MGYADADVQQQPSTSAQVPDKTPEQEPASSDPEEELTLSGDNIICPNLESVSVLP